MNPKVKILSGKFKGKYLEYVGISSWFRVSINACSIQEAMLDTKTPYVVVKYTKDKEYYLWYRRENINFNDVFTEITPSKPTPKSYYLVSVVFKDWNKQEFRYNSSKNVTIEVRDGAVVIEEVGISAHIYPFNEIAAIDAKTINN